MDDDVKEALETIRRDILGGGTTLSYRAALVALDTLEKALEATTADNAALVDMLGEYHNAERAHGTAYERSVGEWRRVLERVEAALEQPHAGAALLARLQPKHLGAVVLAIMDKRRRCVGGQLDGPEGIGAPLRQYLLTGEKP